jgi:NADH-quinone oxidoreductase subunit L
MLVPLFVLAAGAVFAGFVFYPYFIGDGYADFWRAALFEAPGKDIRHHMHEVPEWVFWAPTVAMVSGFALAVLYYVLVPGLPAATARAFRPVYLFFINKWYFDEIYDVVFVRPAQWIGRFLWKKGDGTVIDGTINEVAMGFVPWVTRISGRAQSGYLFHYAFAMVLGLVFLTLWLGLGIGR